MEYINNSKNNIFFLFYIHNFYLYPFFLLESPEHPANHQKLFSY